MEQSKLSVVIPLKGLDGIDARDYFTGLSQGLIDVFSIHLELLLIGYGPDESMRKVYDIAIDEELLEDHEEDSIVEDMALLNSFISELYTPYFKDKIQEYSVESLKEDWASGFIQEVTFEVLDRESLIIRIFSEGVGYDEGYF